MKALSACHTQAFVCSCGDCRDSPLFLILLKVTLADSQAPSTASDSPELKRPLGEHSPDRER